MGIDYLPKVMLCHLYGVSLVQTNPASDTEEGAGLIVHQGW